MQETVERDSDCSTNAENDADDSSEDGEYVDLDAEVENVKAVAAAETRLRRDYGVIELEADGCPIQTFHIGGVTRNFGVLPRSPHHKKGQRVRCTCEHTERVSIVSL